MKNKVFAVLRLTFAITAALVILGTIHVSAKAYTVDEINTLIDGTLSYKADGTSDKDIQSWIDNELVDKAGLSSEWYVMILRQYGIPPESFTKYAAALNRYIETDNTAGIVTRQKYALTLAALADSDNRYTSETVGTFPDGGIMSLVFALHLSNNGIMSNAYDANGLIEKLLSLQKADGGWSVFGDYSDVDVTAMVCQSLAPYVISESAADTDDDLYKYNAEVEKAVSRALSFISEKQQPDGGYVSYGTENPESSAQVIVMLASLSIDPQKDERFIKNGCTVLDGMLEFRKSDGSFSHTADGETNENASMQALYALVAIQRLYSGKSGFYIFNSDDQDDQDDQPDGFSVTAADESTASDNNTEKNEIENNNKAETVHETEETVYSDKKADIADTETDTDNKSSDGTPSYKPYVICAEIVIFLIVGIVLFLKGKRNPKTYVLLIVVLSASVCFVVFTNFESADDYYGSSKQKNDITGHVTFTIRCDTVADDNRPAVILDITEFPIDENAGDTVYTILTDVAREYGILLDVRGSDGMEYVAGIDGLSEFDYGELSGWMYHVNGEEPSVGCGSYTVSDGDFIEWLYTCEFGHDLTDTQK